MRYLLDTHVWLWMLLEPGRLSQKVRKALQPQSGEKPELLISAFSITEFGMFVSKGRLEIDVPAVEWFEESRDEVAVDVIPVSEKVASKAASLGDFKHFDPVDRVIVATALVEKVPLVTADRLIRSYKPVSSCW